MCCGVIQCVLHNQLYLTGHITSATLPHHCSYLYILTGVLFYVRSSSWLSAVMKRPCLFRLIENLDWRLFRTRTKKTPLSLPVFSTATELKSPPPPPPLSPARNQYYSTVANTVANTMPRLNPVSQVLSYYYRYSSLYPASHVPLVQLQLPFLISRVS